MPKKQLGSIFVNFFARNSQYKKSMDQNVKKLNKMNSVMKRNKATMRSFNAMAKKINGTMKGMIVGFASVAGANFLKNKIKEMSDFAAKVYESSIRLGVHTETFQAWRRAFEGESGSIEGADKALEKFTRAVGESRSEIRKGTFDTGGYSEVFKQLGLTAQQIKSQNIEGLLSLVAKGMKETADQTDVAAYGLELFGARGKSAINVLMDGADEFQAKLDYFKGLGTLSLGESERLKAVSQAFTNVGTVIQDVWQKIIVKYDKQIVEFLENKIKTIQKIPAAFEKMLEMMPKIRSFLVAVGSLMGAKVAVGAALAAAAIIKVNGALALLRVALIKTGIGALIVGLGTAIYYFDQLAQKTGGYKRALYTMWEAIKQTFSKAWDVIKAYMHFSDYVWGSITAYITGAMADGLKAIMDLINDARRHFAGLKESIKALFANIGDIMKGIFSDSGKSVAEVMKEGYDKGFNSIEDVGTKTYEALGKKGLEFAELAVESSEKAAKAWKDAAAPYEFKYIVGDKLRKRIAGLPPAFRKSRPEPGTLDPDTLGGGAGAGGGTGEITDERIAVPGLPPVRPRIQALREWQATLKASNQDIAKGMADIGRGATELALNAEFSLTKLGEKARQIGINVADSLLDKSLWTPFTNMMTNLFTKLTDGISKSVSDGAATGAGFWANIFSSFGGGKENGGKMSKGKWYVTGERGREIVAPNANGYVFNNRKTEQMLAGMQGGGFVFAPVINTDDPEKIRAVLQQETPGLMRQAAEYITYLKSQPGKVNENFGGA